MRKVFNFLKTPAGKSLIFLVVLFAVSLIGYTISYGYVPPPPAPPPPPPPPPDACDGVVCDHCYHCDGGACLFDSSCPCDQDNPHFDPNTEECWQCQVDADCYGYGGDCYVCGYNNQCERGGGSVVGGGCVENSDCCGNLVCSNSVCAIPSGLVLGCNHECTSVGSQGDCAEPLQCVRTSIGNRCRNPENPTSPTCCNAECSMDDNVCGDPAQCSPIKEYGGTVYRCRNPKNVSDSMLCSYMPDGCKPGESGYMVGDLNGDGVVSEEDYDRITVSIYGYFGGVAGSADVNGDYVVNGLDAQALRNYLLSGGDAGDTSIGQMRCYSACAELPDPVVVGGNVGDLVEDLFLPDHNVARSGFVTDNDVIQLRYILDHRDFFNSLYDTEYNTNNKDYLITFSPSSDLNKDGVVDESDFDILATYVSTGVDSSGIICDLVTGVINEPTLIIDATPDNQQINLSWSPILSETGYDEFILTRSLCSEEKIFFDQPIDEIVYRGVNNSYNDSGLTNGLEYCYSLFAHRNIDGVDDYSLPAFVQSTPGCYIDNVSNITLNSVASGVFVRWSPVVGSDGYQLTREDDNNNFVLVYQGNETQFIDNSVQQDKTYTYYLSAYKESGCLSEAVDDTIVYQYDDNNSEVPARLFTPSFFADDGNVELSFNNNVVNALVDSVLTITVYGRDVYASVNSLTAMIDGVSYPMLYDSDSDRYIANVMIESVGEINSEIVLVTDSGETDSLSFVVKSWPQGEIIYNLENYRGDGEFDLLIYDVNGNLVTAKSLYNDDSQNKKEKLQATIKIPQTFYFYARGSAEEYSRHSLTAIKFLEGENILIEVRSIPVQVELERGKSQLVDFDSDGINDIEVYYVSVNGENIVIDINNLFESKNIYYQDKYGLTLSNGKYKLVIADGDKEILAKDIIVKNNILNDDIIIKRQTALNLAMTSALSGLKSTFSFVANSAGIKVAQGVINNPTVEKVNEQYAAPAVVTVASVGTIMAIPWWSLLHYLQVLFMEPFAWLFKKRRKGWGVVYNSLTKEPIDLAVVRLYDKRTNQLIKSKITNKNGQYNFFVGGGEYYIKVVKPNFDFPSKILANVNEDKQFTDLYHGGTISVAKGEEGAIIANIPIDIGDITESDKKVIAKKRRNNVGKTVSAIGPLFSVISFIVSPSWLMGSFLATHILLFLLFRRLVATKAPKSWGAVYDQAKKTRIAKAVVRIFSAKYNKLLEVQVTNNQGQYGFITDADRDSVYYITSSKEGYKEYRSDNLDISKKGGDGVISENIYMVK